MSKLQGYRPLGPHKSQLCCCHQDDHMLVLNNLPHLMRFQTLVFRVASVISNRFINPDHAAVVKVLPAFIVAGLLE